MATLGFMGNIPFITSSWQVRTFTDYSRKGDPRLGTHDMIGSKSRIEFIAPPLEEISLTVKLSKQLGINPYKELDKLRRMRDTGEVFNLFLGRKPISQHPWIITSMSESVNYFDRRGNIVSADVSLTLQEYVMPLVVGGQHAISNTK